jgi:cell wall-associated NlpC family hydrolase
VGSSAAALYRSTATDRFPVAGLDVADPGRTPTVLGVQLLADRADQERENAVVRAQRAEAQLQQADRRVAAAEAAVTLAGRDAAGALADTRSRIADLGTAVTAQLAALGGVPGTPTADQQALARWQAYLGALASAGIQPPPAAALTDPAHLPAGMSPARDAVGGTVPGVAWAVVGSHPVTVLPAETVAAVSAALSQLGKPYVAGATGPDTYDCGGFTASSWLLAGYALPVSPQAQWAGGTAVDPADLQVGDLVVTDGGLDVGLYLGDGSVLGASAAGFRVTVRALALGAHAVRVTLGAPAQGNAALVPAPGMGACGAALPTPGPVSPAWGGFSNGRIPASSLCPLGVGGHELRCDAAAAYGAMSSAFSAAFGVPLCITDSYRSYASQLDAYQRKPALAAWPGTSNHGWGLAVDLCGGINSAGTPQYEWMVDNAARFGFVHPDWAQPTGEKPEPWHWEFGTFL